MVENFGSYLKHERELRGVPLEEISGATKIHIRFLQALEDNKFEELPGEVFIKGYIRSYADTIGSDVEEMLNIYEESVGHKALENNLNSENKSNISAKNFLGFAVTGILLLALIFGTKFLLSNPKKSPEEKGNPSSSLPEKVLEKESSPVIEKVSEEKEVSKENLLPAETPVTRELMGLVTEQEIQKQESNLVLAEEELPEDLDKSLKLTIKVKSNSWFNMTIDDFREEDFILSAGEEKSYFGNETFRLTIGNIEGTELTLNEKNLVIPEGKENVVKDFIINSKLIE